MTTMFVDHNRDDGLDVLLNYEDSSISPNNPYYPPNMFDIPLDHMQQRSSFSASSDGHQMHSYLSRPPSLSPSSQSAHLLHLPHSPRSSASPRSVFSTSTTDDMLLMNSFSSTELDQFFGQADLTTATKPDQSFYMPSNNFGTDFQHNFALFNMVNQATEQSMKVQPSVNPQATFSPHILEEQWGHTGFVPPMPVAQSGSDMYGSETPATLPAVKAKRPPALKATVRTTKPAHAADEPRSVGKHNKTERRYRQKVQAAQSDLRDAVPALRVLYGTSTEEQKQTTDIKAPDGTVDGLGEFNRPNASAKTTIFLGARMYIELLQNRVDTLQRKVDELEAFRAAVAGQDNLRQWRDEFNAQEAVLQGALRAARREEDFSDDDEESEEEEPKRKKARAVKTKKAPDVRAFAAFAFSFAFLPSASNVFPSIARPDALVHIYQPATAGEVVRRFPLITAEHTSRLLTRILPVAIAPAPTTLVAWTWRLILAYIFTLVFRRVVRWFDRPPRYAVTVGQPASMLKDAALASMRRRQKVGSDATSWTQLCAQVVGGVTPMSAFERYHLALHLEISVNDAQSLALLALLQPTLPLLRSPVDVWAAAKAAISPETPPALRQVLALHFDEAKRALHLSPPTTSPITAMAEQVTLVHLNDLFSRFFVLLVDSATSGGTPVPDSVKALLANLERGDVGNTLRSSLFSKEIRGVVSGVPKGTAAHALGLVLIGLWGMLAGPTPGAQAALASALAAEEVSGVGSALASVNALRELLYPNSKLQDPVALNLPANAVTIDRLALVCIQFVQLLATANRLQGDSSRLERLAASRKVQRATSNMRLVLTQTTFTGLDDDFEVGNFDEAREKLVMVLSSVGRRASIRAAGRDEDSGLEGDAADL